MGRRRARQLLPRSKTFRDSLIGGTVLHRELGLGAATRHVGLESLRSSFYIAGVQRHALVEVEPRCSIHRFVYDTLASAVWVNLRFSTGGDGPVEFAEVRGCVHGSSAPVPSRSVGQTSLGGFGGQGTSLTLSSKRALLMTGSVPGSERAEIGIWQCPDPRVAEDCDLVDLPGTIFNIPRRGDAWCSTSSPNGENFVIGGTGGCVRLSQVNGHWTTEPIRALGRTEVMALEYQSQTTIMAGQRDGLIHFMDTRSDGKVSRLSEPPLRQVSAE